MRLVLPRRTHPHPVSCTPVSRLDSPPCTSVGGPVNSSKKQRNNRRKCYTFSLPEMQPPPRRCGSGDSRVVYLTRTSFSGVPTLAAAISHQSTKQRTTGGGDRSRQTLTHKMPSNETAPIPIPPHAETLSPIVESKQHRHTTGKLRVHQKGDGGWGGGGTSYSLLVPPTCRPLSRLRRSH